MTLELGEYNAVSISVDICGIAGPGTARIGRAATMVLIMIGCGRPPLALKSLLPWYQSLLSTSGTRALKLNLPFQRVFQDINIRIIFR